MFSKYRKNPKKILLSFPKYCQIWLSSLGMMSNPPTSQIWKKKKKNTTYIHE
jgi:hypothetical protein